MISSLKQFQRKLKSCGRRGGKHFDFRRTLQWEALGKQATTYRNKVLAGVVGGILSVTLGVALGLFDRPKNAQTDRPAGALVEEDLPIAFAPDVPPPINRDYPVRGRVHMDSNAIEMPIDETHTYEYWTFNDRVPGPFLRAREGDVLDLYFTNKDPSGMQHNIDFHAVHGPGGGAPLLTADQGETLRATFKLKYPGLFIYHCAVDPIGLHVGNGMYGLVLVEPQGGLPRADREYYVMQSEFYAEEPEDGVALLQASMERGREEHPSYVVFNGRVGALKGEGALRARCGERVRLFVGNAGPNLVSSFHVIGTVFDVVHREGGLLGEPDRGIQTTLIPAGGAAIVEMDLDVPGTYTLTDHSIWRTDKGAVGFINVEGEPREDLYFSERGVKNCLGCKTHG
eukprot:TRINITY_DN3219_c0_g1_i1.p1 TRINITY_DN3219_c0_g1~~TRINITY_DN3219_c0_g1_i1.p1  ORF type:complete len:398 (-),score=28.25 TRINITY_DN3219_c0_g1_i1:54-1247(-)